MTRGQAKAFLSWLCAQIPWAAPDVIDDETVALWANCFAGTDVEDLTPSALTLAAGWNSPTFPRPGDLTRAYSAQRARAAAAASLADARRALHRDEPVGA